MYINLNNNLVSCDSKVMKVLKANGFKVTKEGVATIMQFRNSITNLSTNERIITSNDYNEVAAKLIELYA